MARRRTNEWEFQGSVLSWCNAYLNSHEVGLEKATQEFPNSSGKRSDVVVWRDQLTRSAVLEIELKTPATQLSDQTFRRDAIAKAQKVEAPYVALWNMRTLALYRTPRYPRRDFFAQDQIAEIGTIPGLRTSDDWLEPQTQHKLERFCHDLLLAVFDLTTKGTLDGVVIDATVFVDALTERVRRTRRHLRKDVDSSLNAGRTLRQEIVRWADTQGLSQFVDNLNESLAAQLAYRLVGQSLFYFAFRRQQPGLPNIELSPSSPVVGQLRNYWDEIRTYDFEALFEESPLEKVTLGPESEEELRKLVLDLAHYDWGSIDVDVLGAIFERLIPEAERIVLGQYYTPVPLADLLVSLVSDGEADRFLDPAVGTGTFLLRAHNRLQMLSKRTHEDLLDQLWGFDISAFATELAIINLCRMDLDSPTNFPRVAVRDFFQVLATDKLEFPPAQLLPGSPNRVTVPLPAFDIIIANPPYIRSQQLDDLDPTFKQRLALIARQAGVPDAKLDAFAYFILHATEFLRPGGRLGFVVSAAWLTASYGNALKKFILSRFRIVSIVWSAVEPFFPGVEVNTVLLVLQRLTVGERSGVIRFVTLTKRLDEMVDASLDSYWQNLDQLVATLETANQGDHPYFRVREIDGDEELGALQQDLRELRNWSRQLKISDIYVDLFGAVGVAE